MSDSERTTNVIVPADLKYGEFANAIRVVEEVGPDCLVDFLEYSASEQEARVVARIRVRRDFLPVIREKLGEAIQEFAPGDPRVAALNAVPRKNGETVH